MTSIIYSVLFVALGVTIFLPVAKFLIRIRKQNLSSQVSSDLPAIAEADSAELPAPCLQLLLFTSSISQSMKN